MKNFWDLYHKYYHRFTNSSATYQGLIELVAQKLPERQVRILDAGCGTGAFSKSLEGFGHQVVGLDSSAQAINKYKISNPQAEAILGDLSKKLEVPDQSFDVIVVINVLYTLLPDIRKNLVKEFRRILKPNGLLICTDPCVGFNNLAIYFNDVRKELQKGGFSSFIIFLKETINYIFLGVLNIYIDSKTKTHYTFFTEESYKKVFEENGATIVNINRAYANQSFIIEAKNE